MIEVKNKRFVTGTVMAQVTKLKNVINYRYGVAWGEKITFYHDTGVLEMS